MSIHLDVTHFFFFQKFRPVERFVFEIGNPEELSAKGRSEW